MSARNSLDPADLDTPATYRILSNTVVPRPIAWVATSSPGGATNLAPHSFFNVIADTPPMLLLSIGRESDTLANLRALPEFTVSMSHAGQAELIEHSAALFPREESEMAWLDIPACPSLRVAPPAVAGAPASFECIVHELRPLGTHHHIVIGEVVMIHLHSALPEGGRIDDQALLPIGRIGARYVELPRPFSIRRPDWGELRAKPRDAK